MSLRVLLLCLLLTAAGCQQSIPRTIRHMERSVDLRVGQTEKSRRSAVTLLEVAPLRNQAKFRVENTETGEWSEGWVPVGQTFAHIAPEMFGRNGLTLESISEVGVATVVYRWAE